MTADARSWFQWCLGLANEADDKTMVLKVLTNTWQAAARPLFKVADPVTRGVDQRKRSRAGDGCDTDRLRLQAAAQNLVRCNPIKHRPSQRVKLVIVCVPEAQISRILVIGVGVRRLPLSASVSSGLRRRNASRRQHDSRCEDSGDLASHIVLHRHRFAPFRGRYGPEDLRPSTTKCAR